MPRVRNEKDITGRVVNVTRFGSDRVACDICGKHPASIGCPNGKHICLCCFDAGYDGDHFYDDNDFHHFLLG